LKLKYIKNCLYILQIHHQLLLLLLLCRWRPPWLAPVIDNAKPVVLIALPGAMTGLAHHGPRVAAGGHPAADRREEVKNMVMTANTVSSIDSYYLGWTSFFKKAFHELKDEVFDDE